MRPCKIVYLTNIKTTLAIKYMYRRVKTKLELEGLMFIVNIDSFKLAGSTRDDMTAETALLQQAVKLRIRTIHNDRK